MTITVNTQKVDHVAPFISYDDVVAYANTGRKAVHSITYFLRRGEDIFRQGTLTPNKSIICEDGMRFTAVVTDNA